MRLALFALVLALLAPWARAQEASFEELELRVTAVRPRAAVIDRGSADGLAKGDRVELYPREVGVMLGRVTRLSERSALVELDDPTYVPVPGTRGKARIPSERLAALPAPGAPAPDAARARPPNAGQGAESAPAEAGETPAHEPWEREDDGWSDDMPLLARVRAVRPEERELALHGRVWASADHATGSENDADYGFDRLGLSLEVDNPLSKGGRLRFDGELNRRDVQVTDGDDFATSRLRIDRLSYALGGTRFDPQRLELGRFLQDAMPEFGVLDGFEWGRRLANGHRVAASIGWMPEYDLELSSFQDFQVAAVYRFVADESERLALTGGYQKTFHGSAADRDLVIAKLEYLPPDAWTFVGSAWIDFYTAGDEAKGAGPELTQAWLTTQRRFEGGSSLSVSYRHQAFPESERLEFTPVTAQQLADDHWERLSARSYARLNRRLAVVSEGGAWLDEDDQGGDAELGVELSDLFFDESLLEIAGFGVRGATSTVLGGRFALGKLTAHGSWRVEYELANHDIDNFTPSNDDIPQHRVRAALDRHTASGWSFSADLSVLLYDEEHALTLGLFVQRSF